MHQRMIKLHGLLCFRRLRPFSPGSAIRISQKGDSELCFKLRVSHQTHHHRGIQRNVHHEKYWKTVTWATRNKSAISAAVVRKRCLWRMTCCVKPTKQRIIDNRGTEQKRSSSGWSVNAGFYSRTVKDILKYSSHWKWRVAVKLSLKSTNLLICNPQGEPQPTLLLHFTELHLSFTKRARFCFSKFHTPYYSISSFYNFPLSYIHFSSFHCPISQFSKLSVFVFHFPK